MQSQEEGSSHQRSEILSRISKMGQPMLPMTLPTGTEEEVRCSFCCEGMRILIETSWCHKHYIPSSPLTAEGCKARGTALHPHG